MGLFVLGAAMVLFSVTLTLWMARRLEAAGRPTSQAWRMLRRPGVGWMGVVLMAAALNEIAGAVLLLVVLIASAVQAVRGARRLPAVWRRVGDPEAWRPPHEDPD